MRTGGRAGAVGGEVESVRASHAVVVVPGDAVEAEARVRGSRPDLRVMSAGRGDRDLQGCRLPEVFAERVRARRPPRQPRARPHADGDREPRHDRGLAPVLDRPRSLPRPQRLPLEPQPLRRALRREGIEFQTENDTEVAAGYSNGGSGRGRRSRRRWRGASTTSTASTRSRWGRRTASRFCATRSPASRRCWPRRTTGWRWRPSTTRLPCCPGADDARMWEPEPGIVYVWERRPSRERRRRDPRSSTCVDAAAGAQPAPSRRRRRRRRARAGGSSTQRVRTPSPAGSTPSSRSRSTATSATTAPA